MYLRIVGGNKVEESIHIVPHEGPEEAGVYLHKRQGAMAGRLTLLGVPG